MMRRCFLLILVILGSWACIGILASFAAVAIAQQTATSPAETKSPAPVSPRSTDSAASGVSPQKAQPRAAPPNYSKEAVVIERLATKVAFEKDGTGTQEVSLRARVQSDSGVQSLAVLTFPYLSTNQNVEFDYVRVRKPDGSVVATPSYNIVDMPAEVTRAAPMYSDIHEKHVTVKALGVGDVLEYVVRYRIFKPQVPGQFWFEYNFAKDTVVPDYELEVTVPADKYLQVVSPDYKPEISEEAGKRIYRWKTSNLESKPPEQRRYGPSPDVQITTFRSWAEVGQWYNQLQAPQLVATPQIKAKAAELIKGLSSDNEKIRAIYDFVSTRFHYVSLSLGNGLYLPHPAEDVLENEYGDCKDKHTLLAALLGAAGIEAWPALINSSRQITPDVPSPGQFDHMITYVPGGNKGLWLDTTPEIAPFGMLLANLRDKQALVIPKDKPAELKRTPANPPFPAVTNFAIQGKLSSDGTLSAHAQESVRGDAEVLFRLAFRKVGAAQWQDLVQKIVSSEGFGGEVSNVQASSPEDTIKPFTFSYDYTRKNYSDWSNHQIIAPLPPIGVEGAATQQKAPLDAVLLGAPGEVLYTARLELPLTITKMPGDFSYSEPWADFQAKYKADGLTLTIQRSLEIKQSDVPLADWSKYQKFAKAVSDDWGAWIQLYDLSSTKEANSPNKAVTSPEISPELDQKKSEAWQALQRNDLSTAESLTLEILQKDPKAQGAHAMLGYIYGRRNDAQDAVEQFRKEQELYPQNTETYRALASYYLYKKQNDLAEEQFRQWLKVDSTNYDAMLGLDQALSREKKYAEAVTLWENAYQQMPDRTHVGNSLALAYIRVKRVDQAIPLLEKGLATETRPMAFNNVAYTLADEKMALDKAQQWGEKALALSEAQSLKTQSEEAALNNTRGLDAIWDTVGWIYFQRGEYEKAEPYLHAAFTLSQDSITGDHLGQDLQKEGKKKPAAHTYLLALASPDHGDKSAIREHYVQLTGRQPDGIVYPLARKPPHPALRRPGSPTDAYSPEEELSRARSYKIPATHHLNGSATFSVVFSPGKIEDVKFASGDEGLKALTGSIMASSMRADFPNTDPAHISRRGILVCTPLGCDFTLVPSDAAHASE